MQNSWRVAAAGDTADGWVHESGDPRNESSYRDRSVLPPLLARSRVNYSKSKRSIWLLKTVEYMLLLRNMLQYDTRRKKYSTYIRKLINSRLSLYAYRTTSKLKLVSGLIRYINSLSRQTSTSKNCQRTTKS